MRQVWNEGWTWDSGTTLVALNGDEDIHFGVQQLRELAGWVQSMSLSRTTMSYTPLPAGSTPIPSGHARRYVRERLDEVYH